MAGRNRPVWRCRLLRDRTFDAFDVEVHLLQLGIGVALAGGEDDLARLVLERAGEGVQLAGLDLVAALFGELLQVGGDGRAEVVDVDRAFLDAPPDVAALPGTGLDVVERLLVDHAPVQDRRGELGLGAELAHVGIPAEGEHALFLGGLDDGRGIGVLHEHIGALGDQRQRGFTLLARVEPAVHPDDAGGGGRIDAAGADGEGVDVADDFRDGDRGDDAELVALAHLAGDDAEHVGAFVGTDVIDAEVLVGLVAGGVHEDGVGEGLGDLDHLVHVAEGGGEDDLVALLRHVAEDAFGVGRFRHVLDEAGLHLAARLGFDRLAADVVGIGPAVVAGRADVYETGLERVGGVGAGEAGHRQDGGGGQGLQTRKQHARFSFRVKKRIAAL